jgi:hypothetical protein
VPSVAGFRNYHLADAGTSILSTRLPVAPLLTPGASAALEPWPDGAMASHPLNWQRLPVGREQQQQRKMLDFRP